MKYLNFLIIFVLLNPLINNLNGLSIKYYNISIIGPVFYTSFFILFSLFLLALKNKKAIIVLTILSAYYLMGIFTNRFLYIHISDMIKVVFPILLFLFVKKIPLNRYRTNKLIKAIIYSAVLYSSFIFITFITGYKYYSFKSGYYGFVHALNDLIVFFLIIIFFIRLLKHAGIKFEIICYFALAFTLTKAILVIPIYLVRYMSSLSFYKNVILFVVIIIVYKYTHLYFERFYDDYFKEAEKISLISENYDQIYINRTLSFGRSTILLRVLENSNKTGWDYLLGSGIEGARISSKGKIGVEMDIVDAFNIYGIIGLFILFFFYYIPMFKLNISYYSKLDFSIVVAYSIFGGHLYNNPLCNVFYGIILGLLSNNYIKQNKGEYFELHNDNKYSGTIQRKNT